VDEKKLILINHVNATIQEKSMTKINHQNVHKIHQAKDSDSISCTG